MLSRMSIDPYSSWIRLTSGGIPSRSVRSYGMSSTRLSPALSSAAVPLRPSALLATSTIASTPGSRLIRTAAARPMPWLAPVTTHTLPMSAAAADDVSVDRLRGHDVGRDRDLDVALGARQDPDRRRGVLMEQTGILGERGVV